MNTTSTEQVINQTLVALRSSKNVEFRMVANEHPDRTVTLVKVADAVNQALRDASQALMKFLGSERWVG